MAKGRTSPSPTERTSIRPSRAGRRGQGVRSKQDSAVLGRGVRFRRRHGSDGGADALSGTAAVERLDVTTASLSSRLSIEA